MIWSLRRIHFQCFYTAWASSNGDILASEPLWHKGGSSVCCTDNEVFNLSPVVLAHSQTSVAPPRVAASSTVGESDQARIINNPLLFSQLFSSFRHFLFDISGVSKTTVESTNRNPSLAFRWVPDVNKFIRDSFFFVTCSSDYKFFQSVRQVWHQGFSYNSEVY